MEISRDDIRKIAANIGDDFQGEVFSPKFYAQALYECEKILSVAEAEVNNLLECKKLLAILCNSAHVTPEMIRDASGFVIEQREQIHSAPGTNIDVYRDGKYIGNFKSAHEANEVINAKE